jgi:hypothetical protein
MPSNYLPKAVLAHKWHCGVGRHYPIRIWQLQLLKDYIAVVRAAQKQTRNWRLSNVYPVLVNYSWLCKILRSNVFISDQFNLTQPRGDPRAVNRKIAPGPLDECGVSRN